MLMQHKLCCPQKASIREETLTQQRLAAMAEGTHQDLAKEWGRSLQQPQPVPYLQAIIDCPSALTFSLDVHTRHTNTTSTINTEVGLVRLVHLPCHTCSSHLHC